MLKDGICTAQGCFATYKGQLLYREEPGNISNHFSQYGANYITPYFVEFLQNIDKNRNANKKHKPKSQE